MTPDDFRALLKRLGLSQTALARLLDRGARTVRRWASGELDAPVEVLLLLLVMEQYEIGVGEVEALLAELKADEPKARV